MTPEGLSQNQKHGFPYSSLGICPPGGPARTPGPPPQAWLHHLSFWSAPQAAETGHLREHGIRKEKTKEYIQKTGYKPSSEKRKEYNKGYYEKRKKVN